MWHFDDVLITNMSKYKILNGSILILNLEKSDSGIYNCTATNSIGSEIISFLIEVFGKLSK